MTIAERLIACLRAAGGKPVSVETIAAQIYADRERPRHWRESVGSTVARCRKQGHKIETSPDWCYSLVEASP